MPGPFSDYTGYDRVQVVIGGRGLVLKSEVLGGENHNTIFPRALSNGLRFVFDRR